MKAECIFDNGREFTIRYSDHDKERVVQAAKAALKCIDSYRSPLLSCVKLQGAVYIVDLKYYGLD
jgi:hypothetical protein